jgi:hypothetical protein
MKLGPFFKIDYGAAGREDIASGSCSVNEKIIKQEASFPED